MDLPQHDESGVTRMIFMGEAELAVGFKLIGFEVWVDPAEEEMDRILKQLVEQREKAFVVLGRQWARMESEALRGVREEGGRIVITAVPPLHDFEHFHCQIDARINAMFARSDAEED